MRNSFITVSLVFLLLLTACQTGEALNSVNPNIDQFSQNQDTLISAISTAPAINTPQVVRVSELAIKEQYTPNTPYNTGVFSVAPNVAPNFDPNFDPNFELTRPRTSKTYLINGFMSAIPFIGFGFRNLHEKMPEAKLYSYLSPIESAGIIMPKVMKDIEAAYAKDPNVSINLIGISLGADFVSIVAEKLHRKNIPVNYLGIVDGTSLRPVQTNVKKVDNLTCTYLDCVRGRVRLAKGNLTTIFVKKRYKSSHIPLGNNDALHARVIAQSRS